MTKEDIKWCRSIWGHNDPPVYFDPERFQYCARRLSKDPIFCDHASKIDRRDVVNYLNEIYEMSDKEFIKWKLTNV